MAWLKEYLSEVKHLSFKKLIHFKKPPLAVDLCPLNLLAKTREAELRPCLHDVVTSPEAAKAWRAFGCYVLPVLGVKPAPHWSYPML